MALSKPLRERARGEREIIPGLSGFLNPLATFYGRGYPGLCPQSRWTRFCFCFCFCLRCVQNLWSGQALYSARYDNAVVSEPLKIVVAEPLTAVDNSFRSCHNFNALRSVQPASQRLDFLLRADLPRSMPSKL